MTASPNAAPGSLETVRAFVNTLDIDAPTEVLATPDDVTSWFRRFELVPWDEPAEDADVDRVRGFREALRAALLANHDAAPIPDPTLAVINGVAAGAGIRSQVTPEHGWLMRAGAGGIDGALGSLFVIVVESIAAGTWPRLKVCANDTCRWAFYDHSRARSGRWCSMAECGNRAKQRAWRDRHATQPTSR